MLNVAHLIFCIFPFSFLFGLPACLPGNLPKTHIRPANKSLTHSKFDSIQFSTGAATALSDWSIASIGPEPWLAVALYCDMRNEKDKALSYIEKALQMGPRQVLAHTLRGDVLLALGKPEHAIVSFFKVSE